MNLSLLDGIISSVESNLEKEAILFYTGNNWQSITYQEIQSNSNIVRETLSEIVSEKWNYIVLYLKITSVYPVLILGILKANLGFICIKDGDASLLKDFIKDRKAKYILSFDGFCDNIRFSTPEYICKKEFTILGETVFFWVSECEDSYPVDSSFLYCIKTSGTTGISKVIQVPHNCIFPNVKDLSEILKITCVDKVLFMTPVTFDPSVIELFLAFYNGCTLCILDSKVKEDPQRILDVLFTSKHGLVTILQTTPSLLKRWNLTDLKEKVLHKNSPLRALILGGEEFPRVEEVMAWNVSQHISIYNVYGLTEVSCWATINQVFPSKLLSNDIGKPLTETVLKLATGDVKEGELLVGSRTRKCLVNDEVSSNIFNEEELFRSTGDIFKIIDGKFFFTGRKDDIVKRWGSSFSLMDVERISKEHENTLDSCCVGIKFENYFRLGLFIVQKRISPLKDFKVFLRKHLPQNAFPDLITVLPALPLTEHGKICKTSLRNICSEYSVTNVKHFFDELWGAYTEETSENLSFISSGGNSFAALQFFNELKLRYPNTPDNFLGMLMQNKTKEELKQVLYNSKIQEQSKIDGQEQSEKLYLEPFKNLQPHIPNYTHVTKTYCKGKKSYKLLYVSKKRKKRELSNLSIQNEWKYNMQKCIDGSPLGVKLSNDKSLIIVGSHSGLVVVLDFNNQVVISLCSLPDRVESSACISDKGDVYYIGCYDGYLYCIGTTTGCIIWKFKTGDMVKSTAVIHSGNILFGSYDTFMYCLNHESRLNWKSKLRSPILAEAVVDGHVVYSATFGSIAALSLDSGLILMEITCSPVFSTPVISGKNLVVANVKGEILWLNLETGKVETSFISPDMIFSSMVKVVQNDKKEIIIYGCHDAYVYCLRERTLAWKTALDSRVVSTPFVKITDSSMSQGFVACFSSAGKGYLLNFSSGEKISDITLPGEVFSSSVVMGMNIIVGCRDDNLYILKINS